MGARLGGSFEQSLVHAHEAGQVGQPLRDPELALDRDVDPPVHPALDRLIDSAREVWPAAGSSPRRCAISFSTAAVWLSVAAMIRRPCGREPRGRARSGKPSRRYPASPSGDRGRPAEGRVSAAAGYFDELREARALLPLQQSQNECLLGLRRGDQPVLQFQASATRGHGLVPDRSRSSRPCAVRSSSCSAWSLPSLLSSRVRRVLRRHRLDPASARAGGVQTRGSCESTYAGFRCRARAAPHACTRSP